MNNVEARCVQIFDRTHKETPTPGARPALCGALCGWIALMTSGCVVGPDYQRPAVPALESQYQAAGGRADGFGHPVSCSPLQGVGPHDAWWKQFHDPKLRELLESAVANNQDLKAAYARVCESRSRYDLSTIGPWPRLDATSAYSRRNQRNPGFLNGVNSNGGSAFDAFSNGLSASWEIDLFGRLRRSIESQDAQWGASFDELRDVLVTLISDVATNYVELRVLQQRRLIAVQNVTVQERSFDIANQRHKAGLVGALDGKQAESVLWTTRASVPQLVEQIQNRINRICILLGESPHEGIRTWLGDGEIPALAAVIPGIPAELVSQRPDVRAAEKRMRAACAEIGVATADLYPRINLVGDLAYDSLDVSQLFSNQAFYSLGPSIRWNVITLGRTRRNIDIRNAQHDESVARFRQTVLKAVEEVENGLVGQRRRSERSEKLDRSADAASDAYDLSLSTYEIGDSNFQRVLEAQRQLLNAQNSSVVAKGDVTLSVIQTYRALGAGWRALEFTGQQMPDADDGDCTVIQFIPRRVRGAAEVPDTSEHYRSESVEFDWSNFRLLPTYDVIPEERAEPSAEVLSVDGLMRGLPGGMIRPGDSQKQVEPDDDSGLLLPDGTVEELSRPEESSREVESIDSSLLRHEDFEAEGTASPESAPQSSFTSGIGPRIEVERPFASGNGETSGASPLLSPDTQSQPPIPTTKTSQPQEVFNSISYIRPVVSSRPPNRITDPTTPRGFGFQRLTPPAPVAVTKIVNSEPVD